MQTFVILSSLSESNLLEAAIVLEEFCKVRGSRVCDERVNYNKFTTNLKKMLLFFTEAEIISQR